MKKMDLLKDCIEWDIVNWSKALAYWEEHTDMGQGQLLGLELGSRRGGLSLWLALKGHDVICSDYKNPENDARKIHSKYSLSGRITYEAIDALNIPYSNKFDIIVFKSILGGISRNGNNQLKQKTIEEIYKALKPGGKLLFAENLVASKAHNFLRGLNDWGSYWNYLHFDEIQPLFSNYSSLQFRTAGFLATFGRNEFQRNFLGKADTLIFDKLVTPRMRYIVMGVATK